VIKRLEDEIRKLERERDRAVILPKLSAFGGDTERQAITRQLDRMRTKLRDIDPTSPYAIP
jgi:hypothetical protein